MGAHSRTADGKPAKSIIIIGAGVFGLSTAYSLLNNSRYDDSKITILDQWTPTKQGSIASESPHAVTPASVDNSRIIRPDYASRPYARLASLAQHEWRQGWPHTLPTERLSESRLPLNPACESVWAAKPYRESGLLLTGWEEGEGLNPKARYYVDGSLSNIRELAIEDASYDGRVVTLPTKEDLVAALGTGKLPGDYGYINRVSGWADAGYSISVLKARTRDTIDKRNAKGKARASFLDGPDASVASLVFQEQAGAASHLATGVTLTTGEVMNADLIVLAAGAWSSKLVPASLASRVKATGQALGYIAISAAEAARFAHIPVPLDLSLGLFIFPPLPMNDGSGRFILKAARHGWGYAYEETVTNTEPHGSSEPDQVQISLPAPHSGDRIAIEAVEVLLDYMRRLGVGKAEQLHMARTCWYADTATGDWIVDYIPRYGRSLFVATGGSGHGFKFAPVLGDWVVKAIEESLDAGMSVGSGQDKELGKLLEENWRWRTDEENREAWLDEGDGSRGGPRGMRWTDEVMKGVECGTGFPAAS